MLDRLGADAEQRARLTTILKRQTRNLSRLVDDLLDVSRITTGKIALRRAPLDLREVAERSLQCLTTAVRARRHEVVLALDAAPVPVHGDPVRLEQVTSNLLVNAVKYTDPGGRIEVTVRRDGDEAVLRVRDNGVGIAPEGLPHVFEPFAQAPGASARAEGDSASAWPWRAAWWSCAAARSRRAAPGQGSEFTGRLPVLGRVAAIEAPVKAAAA